MSKKAILYTSATLNGSWLLVTMDIAIWLHKFKGFKKVSIQCISNYNTFNFFSLLLRLKNLSSYLTKSKLKKLFSFYKKIDSSLNNNSELANFAVGKLDRALLNVGDLEISFIRIKNRKKKSFFDSFHLYSKAITDYLRYFSNYSLKHKTYLKYKLEEIYGGLHVLSEALRSDYKSNGSIFHCRLGILTALYKLHSSLEEYKEIIIPKDVTPYVAGPAQTYIYGFLSRFLSDRGASFIDTSDPQLPFFERQLKEKFFSQLVTSPIKKNNKLIDKKIISKYYESRIDKPWDAFIYMNYLKNIYLSNRGSLNLQGVCAIVYLHSFTDAQYFYGYDGYDDLMDWSFKTISILNENEHVSKVFVKPHPGINPVYHPGDVIANKYLKSKVSNFKKVEWTNFHFDVNNISSSGTVVGVTHHGSIAEELVYKNFPVIASTYSPWGNKYNFGYFWSSLEEYKEIIATKLIKELVVTKNQLEELYSYAFDKHLNVNSNTSFDIDSTWQDLLQIYGVKISYEHGEDMESINKLISKIEPEDSKFKQYIATRLRRINILSTISKA